MGFTWDLMRFNRIYWDLHVIYMGFIGIYMGFTWDL
jgi:hypothetical protein